MGVRFEEKIDFFFSMYCMGTLVTTDPVFSRQLDIYTYIYICICTYIYVYIYYFHIIFQTKVRIELSM